MPTKSKGIYLKYDPQKLEEAVAAVGNGMSFSKASKAFNIPKTTIVDHKTGKYAMGSKPGRAPAIPAKLENSLVSKVVEAADKGFGISKKQLILKTSRLCQKNSIKTPFKNGIPGQAWWEGLKSRHPELSLRKPEALSATRTTMMNRTVTGKFFSDLSNLLKDLGLENRPKQIWNMDETGKQFQHRPITVVARKGSRNVTSRTSQSRENVTILACVNASGETMPPMCIAKGKTKKCLQSFSVTDAPEGTYWTYQERAWMCDLIGEEWFKHVFLRHCGNERPQLLILDSHGSHEVLGLLEEAVKENVHILALPPHTTHYLQPLDRGLFGPFNKAYDRACSEFLNEHKDLIINKATWPKMFKAAWGSAMTTGNVKQAFKATGIFPLNPSEIPESAFAPASIYERTSLETPATISSSDLISDSATSCVELPLMPPSSDESGSANSQVVSTSICSSSSPLPFYPMDVQMATAPLFVASNPESSSSNVILNDVSLSECHDSMFNSPTEEALTASSILLDLSRGGNTSLETTDNADVSLVGWDATWNRDLDEVFGLETISRPVKPKSKTIKSHRLLTSQSVMDEKRQAALLKQEKEKKKVERKQKADAKKDKKHKK